MCYPYCDLCKFYLKYYKRSNKLFVDYFVQSNSNFITIIYNFH